MASARTLVGTALRSLRSAIGGSTVILTYHRVIELESDEHRLAIHPKHFEAQIALLASKYRVLPAAELAHAVAHGRRLPSRSVVVTFDDGYFDLLDAVKPILERYDVPAAAFVSTAEIGTVRERWWDELEFLCLKAHSAAHGEEIRLEVAGETAAYRFQDDSPGGRRKLHAGLYARLAGASAPQRERALDGIAAALGSQRPRRPEYRSLTENELRELASGGLIEIGGHTVNHERPSSLDTASQQREIEEGKNRLEGILGASVSLFSYPHGGRDDITAGTIELVKRAGFDCAFANWFGLAFPSSDPFAIPRCSAGDISAEEFSERLDHWFSLGR